MMMGDDQNSRKQFTRGMLLAWIPIIIVLLPTVIGVISAMRYMQNQKATGLGAVAGGFSEAFATFGVIAFLTAEVVAVTLLARSLSMAHTARSFITVLSICAVSLMILFVAGSLWVLIYLGHR